MTVDQDPPFTFLFSLFSSLLFLYDMGVLSVSISLPFSSLFSLFSFGFLKKLK